MHYTRTMTTSTAHYAALAVYDNSHIEECLDTTDGQVLIVMARPARRPFHGI